MNNNYKFATLDPRPIPAAQAANEAVFASGPVLGVEVTVPALAAQCVLGNIDPQHTGGDAGTAAIEAALTAELPPEGATLATVRADLDSVGAMAVLAIRDRMGGVFDSGVGGGFEERVAAVAAADTFDRGGYPGPKPLPSQENPWPTGAAGASDTRDLAAINAAVADFKVPMTERVATMETWLLTGAEPEGYRTRVEAERTDMIRALEAGEIQTSLRGAVYCASCNHDTRTRDGGNQFLCEVCGNADTTFSRIAIVESTHRAATMVGYALAPIVIARNPAFKLGGGEAHVKFTICAFEAGKFADIRSALAELAELEPGWGGSPTIGGSPQGVSSQLTIDQVVAVVEKHLK